MDSNWYYSETGDQSSGPVSIEDLGRILAAKSNSENFLVWSPGMSDWARAGTLAGLKQYFPQHTLPPTTVSPSDVVATETAKHATSSNLHPWRRYFARMIDIYIFVLFFFFFLGLAFPEFFDEDQTSAKLPASDLLYTFVGIAAFTVFETFCLNVFGGTIGKFLYGIRLVPEAGQKFAFPLALKRSLVVWLHGLGLALPIISLITLIVAYNTLKNDGQTSWDRDFNISVLHRDLSIFRWLLVAVVWLSVLSVYAIILAASKS